MADTRTKDELLEEAQERDIEGRSGMTKAELKAALAADEPDEKPAPKKATSKEKSFGELKREDAQRRLKEARESGASFGLDANDPLLGWDAQQGRVRPVEG